MRNSSVYAIFAGVLSVAAIQNVTIDDLDRSIVLSPLPVWSWSSEGTGKINGTFSFSNNGSANIFFTFPVPATAVYWQGFKRSGAALYSICIDCAGLPNDTNFLAVDGHDDNTTTNDLVTTLFSKTGLSNTIHNLTIRNHLDPRFPGSSQITLDGFIITTSQNQTLETTNVASMSMPAGPSVTALSTPTNNAFLEKGSNPATAIGIAVASTVVVIVAVVFLLLYLRRRRTRYTKLGEGGSGEVSPMADTLETKPKNAEQRSMVVGYEDVPITPAQSDIYHMFPAPPQRFPSAHQASGAYPSNHITSDTRPASPQQHTRNSDSISLEVPLLLAPKAPHQPSPPTTSSKTFSSYIPISISNVFAGSPTTEESSQYHEIEREPISPSERNRWYPSLLLQDIVEPGRRRRLASQKPEPPPGTYPRPVSVASKASLRVSGIIEATREAMTPDIEKSGSAQGSPPRKLSPPLGKPSSHKAPGHGRTSSSSVFF
ncbi:hypothetical protein JB92DRAFT_2874004 [Gautieria morchelliformis]|nr:hypothetical protein JB92DRAFT_2874004 [Gautieria morchelliformis]